MLGYALAAEVMVALRAAADRLARRVPETAKMA
jgi:hypothetical protein